MSRVDTYRTISTVFPRVIHMRYLFHEPVRAVLPSRSDALGAGAALTLAIVGTTLATIVLAAVTG